ncbi:hypothetical protein [Enterococcus phage vB_OCPT_Ben]|uniref:Uncharacterized protein n=2 Tax=Schiekvirus TaxID=2732968 RepID=A0AAE9GBR0_9CAUD|nr:hypothetical protein [Enterococcus phage vB_OCPT_Ben]UKM17538.1 hypothetical protein [Enterococcus phage UTI-EfS3]UNZ10623.1 hypothetical protein DIEEDFHO_00181 [Enterococcus phage vB_OCPT_Bill]
MKEEKTYTLEEIREEIREKERKAKELEELLAKLPEDVLCEEYYAMENDMFYAWENGSCEQVQKLLSKHKYNLDSIQLVHDVFYTLNNLVEGEIEYGK